MSRKDSFDNLADYRRLLVVPDHEPGDEPEPYPCGIWPGKYSRNAVVALLRSHKHCPDAIQFIADMMEE